MVGRAFEYLPDDMLDIVEQFYGRMADDIA